jgi:cytochrome c
MIMMGLLACFLLVMGISTATQAMFNVPEPEKPSYVVAGCETDRTCGEGAAAAGAPAEVAAAGPSALELLHTAAVDRGVNEFKKCATCHNIAAGGANKTGPNLWGIMGAKHAQVAGFKYSDAMQATAADVWSWEAMDKWLENPKAYIPGNKMAFAGIRSAEARAALMLYLNQSGDTQLPLPPKPEPTAVAEAAPAEGEAPAEGSSEAVPAEAVEAAPQQ